MGYSQFIAAAVPDKLSGEFDRIFSLIAENPKMGRRRDELERGLRSIPLGHYVIFYAVADGIDVLRVLHNRRDIEDTFGG